MKYLKLKRDFFARPTLQVARDLLGKVLVRKLNGRVIRAIITETEAYCGPSDLACHASKGKTARTEVMFGPAGHAYVYLVYGMYHCLNVVTEKKDYPAAVLVRGVTLETKNYKLEASLNGPGKVCRFLEIDRKLNKIDMTTSQELWLEDHGLKISSRQIRRTPRIGVDYAKEYKDKLWRFVLNLSEK